MDRAWVVLGAAVISVAPLGLAFLPRPSNWLARPAPVVPPAPVAAPGLPTMMAVMQGHNATILRGHRTPVAFARDRAAMVSAADQLVSLGLSLQGDTTTAAGFGLPQATWDADADAFVNAAQDYVLALEAQGVTYRDSRTAYRAVSSACVSCHEAFRLGQ